MHGVGTEWLSNVKFKTSSIAVKWKLDGFPKLDFLAELGLGCLSKVDWSVATSPLVEEFVANYDSVSEESKVGGSVIHLSPEMISKALKLPEQGIKVVMKKVRTIDSFTFFKDGAYSVEQGYRHDMTNDAGLSRIFSLLAEIVMLKQATNYTSAYFVEVLEQAKEGKVVDWAQCLSQRLRVKLRELKEKACRRHDVRFLGGAWIFHFLKELGVDRGEAAVKQGIFSPFSKLTIADTNSSVLTPLAADKDTQVLPASDARLKASSPITPAPTSIPASIPTFAIAKASASDARPRASSPITPAPTPTPTPFPASTPIANANASALFASASKDFPSSSSLKDKFPLSCEDVKVTSLISGLASTLQQIHSHAQAQELHLAEEKKQLDGRNEALEEELDRAKADVVILKQELGTANKQFEDSQRLIVALKISEDRLKESNRMLKRKKSALKEENGSLELQVLEAVKHAEEARRKMQVSLKEVEVREESSRKMVDSLVAIVAELRTELEVKSFDYGAKIWERVQAEAWKQTRAAYKNLVDTIEDLKEELQRKE